MSPHSAETRDRILDSVLELILEGGVQAVTLSRVCQLSRLSKGGLVHYFPSKESLIVTFIQRAAQRYLEMVESAWAEIPPGAGKRALAFVREFIADPAAPHDFKHDCVAVMVALIQSGQPIADVRSAFDSVLKQLREDGISRELANTILIAVDGFWFQSVIEDPAEMTIRARLLRKQINKLIREEIEA
jgi:AcrR family transcriptional regulator